MNKLTGIIIATLVVIIIALVITVIVLATSSDNTAEPTRAKQDDKDDKNIGTKTYKYIETTDASHNIVCPEYVVNGNVKKDRYCIVPKPFAKQICQSLPNCGGYAETTNTGWNTMFPNSVSLFDNNFRTGTASPEWKAYKQIYE